MPEVTGKVGRALDIVGESPVWDEQTGRLYWVDMVGKRVRRWTEATNIVETRSVADFPSAVGLCRLGTRLVLTIGRTFGTFDFDTGQFFPEFVLENDPVMRINEGKCDPQGRFWCASMENNLHADGSPREQSERRGRLFRVSLNKVVGPIAEDLGIPNTMVWSPSGDRFYLGDSARNVIWVSSYDAQAGKLGKREVFAERGPGVPDGSAIDAEGYLWNARFGAGCIIRYGRSGQVDRIVELPARNPTSCCFGGEALTKLFVTSANYGTDKPTEWDGAVLVVGTDTTGLVGDRYSHARMQPTPFKG
jgi:sugar lactone lactonase YvrE